MSMIMMIKKKKNMQDPIQSPDEVEEKQVEHIEDSQPELETQPQDLEKAPKRIDLNTPTKIPQRK